MALLRGHWQLLVLSALVLALWNTPVSLPLKLLVVVFHETAHALAALATGGTVDQISVSPDQGGFTLTRGGAGFAIMSAGYLGSLLIGVALFFLALLSRADRVLLGLLGGAMLLVTALYVRDMFAIGFCLGTGVLMLVAARYLPGAGCDLVLRVIGLTSMAYVPIDILSDTIFRAGLRSDARMLAEEYGGPTWGWGGLWLIVSLAVIVLSLRFIAGRDSNIAFRRGSAGPE